MGLEPQPVRPDRHLLAQRPDAAAQPRVWHRPLLSHALPVLSHAGASGPLRCVGSGGHARAARCPLREGRRTGGGGAAREQQAHSHGARRVRARAGEGGPLRRGDRCLPALAFAVAGERRCADPSRPAGVVDRPVRSRHRPLSGCPLAPPRRQGAEERSGGRAHLVQPARRGREALRAGAGPGGRPSRGAQGPGSRAPPARGSRGRSGSARPRPRAVSQGSGPAPRARADVLAEGGAVEGGAGAARGVAAGPFRSRRAAGARGDVPAAAGLEQRGRDLAQGHAARPGVFRKPRGPGPDVSRPRQAVAGARARRSGPEDEPDQRRGQAARRRSRARVPHRAHALGDRVGRDPRLPGPVTGHVPHRAPLAPLAAPANRLAFVNYVVPAFVIFGVVAHMMRGAQLRWIDPRTFEALSNVVLFLGLCLAFVAVLRSEPTVQELAGQIVLALGAHPDDIELGCGGFLLKLKASGAKVYGLTFTRGEVGTRPDARRDLEGEKAAAFLGLDGYWVLGFPDTGLQEKIPALKAAIEAMIKELGATVVLTHSDADLHGDHRAISVATREAARGVPTVLCYEDVSTTDQFSPNFYVDISQYMDDHLKACALHRTQDHRTYMDPEVIQGRAAHRGMQVGVRYALAFRTLNMVR